MVLAGCLSYDSALNVRGERHKTQIILVFSVKRTNFEPEFGSLLSTLAGLLALVCSMEITPPTRPRLLTFLCLLTFFSAISGLWTQSERLWSPALQADKLTTVLEQVREQTEAQNADQETSAFIERMFDSLIGEEINATNMQKSAIILLIYESLPLFGAYLMWNRQRRGFFVYLAGIGVVIVAPLVFIGGWFGIITLVSGAIFSTIFAALYATQLKYMD